MSEALFRNVKLLKEEVAIIKNEIEEAKSACDLERMADLKYGAIPRLEKTAEAVSLAIEKEEADNFKIPLRSARARANLSRDEAAELLGVTPPSITRWEKENRVPRTRIFYKICEIYGCPPERLDVERG